MKTKTQAINVMGDHTPTHVDSHACGVALCNVSLEVIFYCSCSQLFHV